MIYIYIDGNVCFEIDEIEIDKIRISKEYPYGKNGKYRNFVFYEHENEYVMLKGNVYNFDVFEDIEKIIYSFETRNGFEYLETNVPRNVVFKVDGIDNNIPYTNDRYLCNAIIEIQHVQHEKKDEDKNVKYYRQICLTDCYCDIV